MTRDDLREDPPEYCFVFASVIQELGYSFGGQSFCNDMEDLIGNNNRPDSDWKSNFAHILNMVDAALEEKIEDEAKNEALKSDAELQADYMEAQGHDRD